MIIQGQRNQASLMKVIKSQLNDKQALFSSHANERETVLVVTDTYRSQTAHS